MELSGPEIKSETVSVSVACVPYPLSIRAPGTHWRSGLTPGRARVKNVRASRNQCRPSSAMSREKSHFNARAFWLQIHLFKVGSVVDKRHRAHAGKDEILHDFSAERLEPNCANSSPSEPFLSVQTPKTNLTTDSHSIKFTFNSPQNKTTKN